MSSDQDIPVAPTLPDLVSDPPVNSVVVISATSTKELYPGWCSRWNELGRYTRPPGTLQRDLDGSHTIVGPAAWQKAYIMGEIQ